MSVSILIPCYNAGDKVLKAIGSAIAQPSVDEIVVLDDASDDGITVPLLNSAAKNMPKVKVLGFINNKGAQVVRNELVSQSARGDDRWLCFLDADDELIGENSLSRRKHESALVTYCDMEIERYENNQQYVEPWPTNRLPLLRALARFEHVPSTSALLIKRSVFEQISWDTSDAYFKGMHCFKFLLDCLMLGINVQHVPVMGILYRDGWSPDQISGTKNRLNRLIARYTWAKSFSQWLTRENGGKYYIDDLNLGHAKFNQEWQTEISKAANSGVAELPMIDRASLLNEQFI
ncbi:MAG TPA: hypothetical protein DCY88_07745 [Cyanobacteria bacterium UBA11372]|nr:hypothetical protein [Cyanobacteria bacterium UBA11372]